MAKRSELREKIMTILYQLDMYEKNSIDLSKEDVIEENVEIESEFVNEIVSGVVEHEKEIDDLANKYLKNWTIDRIESLGRAILRMGIYEIKYTNTPDVVAVNEALELTKKYCDDSVRKIVNAVLDKIINE